MYIIADIMRIQWYRTNHIISYTYTYIIIIYNMYMYTRDHNVDMDFHVRVIVLNIRSINDYWLGTVLNIVILYWQLMKLPTGVIKRGWEVHLFKMEVYSWENHRTK